QPFAPDRLNLLKLKNPVDDRHISDIQNFTLQVDEEEDDNVILMKDMRKIATMPSSVNGFSITSTTSSGSTSTAGCNTSFM
ncbi:22603_t:CDS:2, partial [Rhizophagus irregularis]